jgi:hypothetical protein
LEAFKYIAAILSVYIFFITVGCKKTCTYLWKMLKYMP